MPPPTELSAIADGGLGEQVRAWLDIVAVWDAAPAALLKQDVDLLCTPPPEEFGGELLGAIIPVLLLFEDAKRAWSARLWQLDNRDDRSAGGGSSDSPEAAPLRGTDAASLRVLQVLAEAASLSTGAPGAHAAWDIQGLRAAKFAPVLAGKPPVPAAVSAGARIAQRQLVPATAAGVSPFFAAVIEALQRHVARCNMPRPSACTRELALLCDVTAGVDEAATRRLRKEVQVLALAHSSAAAYALALRTSADIIADSMHGWATQLADMRTQDTAAWRGLKDYLDTRSSLFLNKRSVCAAAGPQDDSVRSWYALDAAMECYGFRCVLALVHANISVMAGKWDTPPEEYDYALTSMATWTVEMRRWVVLVLGDMCSTLDRLDPPQQQGRPVRALQDALGRTNPAVWGDQDAATLASMETLFAASAPGWQKAHAGSLAGAAASSARESLPLGWEDLGVSAASMATSKPYDEVLALMHVIVRNERAIRAVLLRHNAAQ